MSEGQSPEGLPEQHRNGADEEEVRQESQDRVQDPVEAEHMAHAMKPHVERAQAINNIYEQNWENDENGRELKTFAEAESLHEGYRDLHLQAERVLLSEAEDAARDAADEAGAAESERYRRERESHDT
jgi:hypothetical protein